MIIRNATQKKILAKKAFFSAMFGLMFRKITKDEACVLENKFNDRLGAGIHMFFVPQELDVLWLDKNKKVVDRKHCKCWKFYWPKSKAKWIIELLDAKNTKIGDKIKF